MYSTGILTVLVLCVTDHIRAKTLPNIYWNSTNPMFGLDNTDHVFAASIRDVVNIHCPLYNDTVLQVDAQYSIIYQVSKYGYDNCILDEKVPVGQCRSPYTASVIRVFLRKYSPVPNGLEFEPGSTYYFISTSDSTEEGINNSQGGLCKSHNMKIKIEVSKVEKRVIVPTLSDSQEESLDLNLVSPRWRTRISTTQAPTTTSSDLRKIYSKFGAPTWWRPSSAPKENDELAAAAYEIHQEDEELDSNRVRNTKRHWNQPYSDAQSPPKQEIILFQIEEVSDESQLRYHGGSSKMVHSLTLLSLAMWWVLRLC